VIAAMFDMLLNNNASSVKIIYRVCKKMRRFYRIE